MMSPDSGRAERALAHSGGCWRPPTISLFGGENGCRDTRRDVAQDLADARTANQQLGRRDQDHPAFLTLSHLCQSRSPETAEILGPVVSSYLCVSPGLPNQRSSSVLTRKRQPCAAAKCRIHAVASCPPVQECL
jgi:hypothetical protein